MQQQEQEQVQETQQKQEQQPARKQEPKQEQEHDPVKSGSRDKHTPYSKNTFGVFIGPPPFKHKGEGNIRRTARKSRYRNPKYYVYNM